MTNYLARNISTISQAHHEILWSLDPSRQSFLDENNIDVIAHHDDGLVAIALQQPEEIFDFMYLLYRDSPDTEVLIDAAKNLYTPTKWILKM